jgi:hypothetical protein
LLFSQLNSPYARRARIYLSIRNYMSLSLADRLASFTPRLHPRRNRYACLRRAVRTRPALLQKESAVGALPLRCAAMSLMTCRS